ncbi:MAG: hypothetical protein JOZ77_08140 [Candidatus Eremiobacteraeota bacterium]|nr:hypothetical protein [Candidatus Eremiobacteraeota bacterium]
MTTNLEVAENAVHRLGGLPARAFEHVTVAIEDHARVHVPVAARENWIGTLLNQK